MKKRYTLFTHRRLCKCGLIAVGTYGGKNANPNWYCEECLRKKMTMAMNPSGRIGRDWGTGPCWENAVRALEDEHP